MKKVLVFEGKHGNTYFDASTKERVWKAFYDEVTNRNALGYWYSHYRDIPKYPEPPKTTLEMADQVGESSVAEHIRGLWKNYESRKREIDEAKRGKEMLERALSSEGKDASAKNFFDRSGGNYQIHAITEVEV